MARLSSEAQDRYPGFDAWVSTVFYTLVVGNARILKAFWKWSNFTDTAQNRLIFTYGTPPTIGLIDGSTTCTYNADGTPAGVLYGQTWNANQIGINTTLLDLFVDAVAKPLPFPNDTHTIIEVVKGTILHEMVHWSYYANGPIDESKKYDGDEEYGTRNFELEAFGHPIRLPLSRLCKSKAFPYLGITWDQMTEYSDRGPHEIIRVKGLDPNSPAAKFGIKVGDVVRKFDGDEIWGLPEGFSKQLQAKKPGQVVRLEGYRTSKININIDVTLDARPVGK